MKRSISPPDRPQFGHHGGSGRASAFAGAFFIWYNIPIDGVRKVGHVDNGEVYVY